MCSRCAARDWSADRPLLEWLAELVGIRIGLAVAEAELGRIVRETMRDFPVSDYKQVNDVFGRSALERLGLRGAVAAGEGVIPHVCEKVGDDELAVRAIAFMMERVVRPGVVSRECAIPGAGSDLIAEVREGRHLGSVHIPQLEYGIEDVDTQACVAEALRLHGRKLADAVAVVVEQMQFRSARSPIVLGVRRQWNDVLDLSELFSTESVMASYGRFFDQRFVNYLAANYDAVGTIHWRKFEGLVAEYFHRAGFQVEIGPGRNDNGVDIRVWGASLAADVSPPTLLIQCKRVRREIDKVVVKALAADVAWDGAQQGLLVATADWSPGAREVVRTRSYPVAEVNRAALQLWLEEMRIAGNGVWYPA
ncbi:restriction endonuclease [Streptomyces sp. MCA2]|uniref:restriction endonuclease n=1 Tax=Streptomyces sp. MCA2 TaxID=2944805 RepID=UPI0020223135|nr:restriction endonuclease [Streptomyces sp. MCA2]MCL7493202.1 restriction endonuclease [Streptomyces sp. MCA2]